METTPEAIKAAYDLLRVTAFKGVTVRPSSKVKFVAKKFKDYQGLYHWPAHRMEIDASIHSITNLLQVVAHEMCHAVLDNHGDDGHENHDENFQKVANIICAEMGWPKGRV